MKYRSEFAAVLAAVILSSSVFTSCARIRNDDAISSGTSDSPVQTMPAPTVTSDENVPANTIPHPEESRPEDTTASPAGTDITEGTTSAVETKEPVTSHDITEADVVTNEKGEIIDDYKSDIVFDTEDPDELYNKFGLSRQKRKSYYNSISKEHDLPIVHISTENEKEILSRENYINCLVEIMNCEDEYVMDAVSGEVRVRGNASAFYGDVDQLRKEGAPYRLKFTHKQSVLGLNDNARCKSWVLLKTYGTGVRDHMAFELAKAVNNGDYYASDSRFVQVYVNEEYKGLYLLCEQSQENPNRVAINECEKDYLGTDIGYFVELDNYSYEEPWRFMLNYNNESITDFYGETRVPKKYYYTIRNDIYSEEQKKFIERYFEVCYEIPMRAIKYGEYYRLNDDFTLTPAQDEFSSAAECVSQVLDLESFVDMYITYEIVNDQDVGGGSFFFAVDFGSISKYKTLTCVSPWDFSWAYTDYSADSDGGLYAARFKDSYFVDHWGDRSNPWLILLYSADWFRDMVCEKWQERYPYILETVSDVRSTIDRYSKDFNKDDSSRASRARTTVNWTENRIEYLNSLWG